MTSESAQEWLYYGTETPAYAMVDHARGEATARVSEDPVVPADDSQSTGARLAAPNPEPGHPAELSADSSNASATTGQPAPIRWEVAHIPKLGTGTIMLKPGDVRHSGGETMAMPILHAELVVNDREPITVCLFGPSDEYLIGRDPTQCNAAVSDPRVSRVHLAILSEDGTAVLRDCNSTNGTFVNGTRVVDRREIHSGDRIGFGRTDLEFRILSS